MKTSKSSKITHTQFKEDIDHVFTLITRYDYNMRLGQILMIVFSKYSIVKDLEGSEVDPYSNDRLLDKFFTAILDSKAMEYYKDVYQKPILKHINSLGNL